MIYPLLLKNKTIYLILFIPLFVFISLKFVDQKDANFRKTNIGLIQNEKYPPVIMKSIKAADNVFAISWLSHEEEGKRRLKEKNWMAF